MQSRRNLRGEFARRRMHLAVLVQSGIALETYKFLSNRSNHPILSLICSQFEGQSLVLPAYGRVQSSMLSWCHYAQFLDGCESETRDFKWHR